MTEHIPETFDLMWMQTMVGSGGLLRSAIPVAEALGLLQSEQAKAARGEYGMGVVVYLRPSEKPRPIVVCLCGSTRFWREFQKAGLAETMAGRIVLSIGAASGTDDEHFGNLPRDEYNRVKAMLDELHVRKIDMADEILILNLGGYIGESTARELAYAQAHGKRIRYLEEPEHG